MLDPNMETLRSIANSVITRGGSPTAEAICKDTLRLLEDAETSHAYEDSIPEVLQ